MNFTIKWCEKQWNMWKILVFWIVIVLLIKNVLLLQNVSLTIDPEVVQRYTQAALRCSYDLGDDHLYSVKWYRGIYEFYRYTPSESPSTKIFSTVDIIVDEAQSNSTQVTLLNIDFLLSGKFTCEVTTEQPLQTGSDTKSMLVIQLPADPPKISVSRKPLDYGDTLQANCSTSRSRPRAKLTFLLNDYQVAQTEPLSPRQALEFDWNDLLLSMQLTEFHFSSGRLILTCRAEIEDIYHEEAVLRLDSAREPVPERVSAYSGSCVGFLKSSAIRTVLLVNGILYIFWKL